MKLITRPHEFRTKPERGRRYSIRAIVEAAIENIDDYAEGGFTPTLRQLFYRLVTLQILVNCYPDYRNLGRYINFAKGAGMIDWDSVEDRTRLVRGRNRYNDIEDWAESSLAGWHMDFWAGQPVRPEIWIEKDALLGIIKPICDKYDVRFYSLRGWGRPADNFSAAQRFLQDFYDNPCREKNRVFHLGDYDPTGCAVTPQIDAAVREFGRQIRSDRAGSEFGSDDFVDIVRIGLTKEQIKTFNIVPNRIGDEDEDEDEEDAKAVESRKAKFLADNDGCSDTWELDALDPKILQELVEDAIKSCITHPDAWDDRQRFIASQEIKIRTMLLIEATPDITAAIVPSANLDEGEKI